MDINEPMHLQFPLDLDSNIFQVHPASTISSVAESEVNTESSREPFKPPTTDISYHIISRSYPPEVDNALVEWILSQRQSGLAVSIQNLQDKAKVMILPHNPKFRASYGWVQTFKMRHSIVLRQRTTVAKKLPANL